MSASVTSAPDGTVRRLERAQVDVGQRVAVHDEEGVYADDGERLPRTAGASEHGRLFPRVADASAEVAAVTKACRDGGREMVQVDDEIGHTLRDQPADDVAHDRFAGERHGRFRAD